MRMRPQWSSSCNRTNISDSESYEIHIKKQSEKSTPNIMQNCVCLCVSKVNIYAKTKAIHTMNVYIKGKTLSMNVESMHLRK